VVERAQPRANASLPLLEPGELDAALNAAAELSSRSVRMRSVSSSGIESRNGNGVSRPSNSTDATSVRSENSVTPRRICPRCMNLSARPMPAMISSERDFRATARSRPRGSARRSIR
jgi:hypothetical protein